MIDFWGLVFSSVMQTQRSTQKATLKGVQNQDPNGKVLESKKGCLVNKGPYLILSGLGWDSAPYRPQQLKP